MKELRHYFIPHPETHQKAHLLSWHFLLIYILLFMLLRVTIDLVSIYQPGVLGVNSNINAEQIIDQTNKERAKKGLAPLTANATLSTAAMAKARNMFEENYWAHFSPSGKDPWNFITAAGYKFSYAGENLARNFQTSDEIVKAWMNSPSHRDNILNSKYEEIGIAVFDGVLQGQKTTLIVQMFGKSYEPLALKKPEVDLGGQKIFLGKEELIKPEPGVLAGTQNLNTSFAVNPALINPFNLIKVGGIILIFFLSLLTALDLIILKRRGVYRVSSHHIAHLSFLALFGIAIILGNPGDIL